MSTAVVSGTFDPITVGHTDVISRACAMFDRVIIAVSENAEKKCFFPSEVRLKAVSAAIKDIPGAEAELCRGLLADFCIQHGNAVLVRGARSGSDFDYERSLCIINRELGVRESIVLPASKGTEHISSTYAREMLKYGKDTAGIIPSGAYEVIRDWLKENR